MENLYYLERGKNVGQAEKRLPVRCNSVRSFYGCSSVYLFIFLVCAGMIEGARVTSSLGVDIGTWN